MCLGYGSTTCGVYGDVVALLGAFDVDDAFMSVYFDSMAMRFLYLAYYLFVGNIEYCATSECGCGKGVVLVKLVGHIFPVYYGFRGGKGVLVSATMALILSPILFAIMFAIFVLLVATSKYVSLGSVTSAIVYPLLVHGLFGMMNTVTPPLILLITIMIAVIITVAHKENLKRIGNRTERKLSFKKKSKESADEK